MGFHIETQPINIKPSFKNSGLKIRSLDQFVADITGGITETGIKDYVSTTGEKIKPKEVAQQFHKFAQHMQNKVNALNTSFDGNTPTGSGNAVGYDTLVKGYKFAKSDNLKKEFLKLFPTKNQK